MFSGLCRKLSWWRVVALFENRLTKNAYLFTSVGYLILLNDILIDGFGFRLLTSDVNSILGISAASKLSLVYFGFLFLTIGRIGYLIARPHAIKHGPMPDHFVDWGLKNLTYFELQDLYANVQNNEGHTLYGKNIYDDDWIAFRDDAHWEHSGATKSKVKQERKERFSFAAAKEKHESMLRALLLDTYFESSDRRRLALSILVCICTLGHALILIPSFDLALSIALRTLVLPQAADVSAI